MTKKITWENGERVVREMTPDEVSETPPSVLTSQHVNSERDRRLAAGFSYGGNVFDSDAASVQNVIGSATLARFAVLSGAQAGDLRWLNPSVDFTWITQANVSVDVDAQTMVALGDALTLYRQSVIFAGRALKDTDPIPTNFTNDQYWP
mgnify:CR=1 FL=1